jgi:hypothetical protein
MITDEIFHQLKSLDRDLTENQFATRYLKTSRSYLCNRRNKRRDVSNDVLLNLYTELSGLGVVWQTMAAEERNDRARSRWQRMADLHAGLADEVVNKLLERAKASAGE